MANTQRGYPNEQTGYPNRLDQDFKVVSSSTTAFEVWRDDGTRAFYIDSSTPTIGLPSSNLVITSASANALTVGPTGTTNPSFNVDASTASAITGLNVKGAASGSGVTLASLGGASENIIMAPKGSTSGVVVNQNSALAFVVTPAANLSNPVLSVDTSVTSQADGLLIQGQATTAGVNLTATSNGATSILKLDAKSTGAIVLGGTSTGQVSLGRGSASPPLTASTVSTSSGQSITLTAAILKTGILRHTVTTGAATDTLDTGANMDTGFPTAVAGDTFVFYLMNTSASAFAITLAGAANMTLSAVATTIAQNKGAILFLRKTSTGNWTCDAVVGT